MSLEDRFNEITPPASRCKTCHWYQQLDPSDAAFFNQKATAGNMKKLWRACRANGLDCHYASFLDHMQEHYGSR